MRNDKSMIDVAYEVVDKAGKDMSFADIAAEVAKELEMSQEEINERLGMLYTNLTYDGRFVAVPSGEKTGTILWGLRKSHLNKVHLSVSMTYGGTDDGDVKGDDSEGDEGDEDSEDGEDAAASEDDEENADTRADSAAAESEAVDEVVGGE